MSALARHRGLRVLLGLSCFVVVVAGFKAANEFMIPIMLALFLSLLSIPPMRRLEQRGVPSALALAIVVLAATLVVFVILVVIGRSITEFQEQMPLYQERLNALVGQAVSWLEARNIDASPAELAENIDGAAVLRLVGNTVNQLLLVLSNLVLIILTMVFMLWEASSLPGKLRAAMGSPNADLVAFSTAAQKVQKYLAIKAWVSLVTAACIAVLCWACGVDFPLLWALIAFLFNFVPNIGSIIAAVPAVMLTLIQHGAARAALVIGGYVAVNMLIGNVIEPRLLGRKLGLSPLVVFLSLLFWGWVWGPVGMLLSVPLTVILKILLEQSDDFRWIAIMLGP